MCLAVETVPMCDVYSNSPRADHRRKVLRSSSDKTARYELYVVGRGDNSQLCEPGYASRLGGGKEQRAKYIMRRNYERQKHEHKTVGTVQMSA